MDRNKRTDKHKKVDQQKMMNLRASYTKRGSLRVSKEREYEMVNSLNLGDYQLYGIAFNFLNSNLNDVFAVAGGKMVMIYHCEEAGDMALLQSYEDNNEDEAYYTLCWACNQDGTPYVVAAGKKGIIQVIDLNTENIHVSLVGHGEAVNEVRAQPMNPSIIVSVSKDESVRLWNVQTGVFIFRLSGHLGHQYQVLSADFHPGDRHKVITCGMDGTIRLWCLKEFWGLVDKSFKWKDIPSRFPAKYIQYPQRIFSVHQSFVDCNRWLGNLILSKSVENEILLWDPKLKDITNTKMQGNADILQSYPVPGSELWFIKFSTDFKSQALAIGNKLGKIYVWNLQSSPPVLLARLVDNQCKDPIRHTALSFDGSTILACDNVGRIWRWDQKTHDETV